MSATLISRIQINIFLASNSFTSFFSMKVLFYFEIRLLICEISIIEAQFIEQICKFWNNHWEKLALAYPTEENCKEAKIQRWKEMVKEEVEEFQV